GGHIYAAGQSRSIGSAFGWDSDVLSLNLPAGKFIITAKLLVLGGSAPQNVTCSLSTGDASEAFTGNLGEAAGHLSMSLLDVADFSSPGAVTLHCGGFDSVVAEGHLTAVSVAAIN